MDLVRLEAAVERPMVFFDGDRGSWQRRVVLSYRVRRDSRADVPPSVWSKKTRIQIHQGTCSTSGTLLGWTYKDSSRRVREIQQLSFFRHNSNFFQQPSSLRVNVAAAAAAVGQQNLGEF